MMRSCALGSVALLALMSAAPAQQFQPDRFQGQPAFQDPDHPPAQPAQGQGQGRAQQAQPTQPDVVTLRRIPLEVVSPQRFHVPLRLEPARRLPLAAGVDGFVRAVDVVPGQQVAAQEMLVRLDTAELDLRLREAEARAEAAQQATAAEQAVADVQVELARLAVERAGVRAPLHGTVLAVHVVPGQYVRAGEPLLDLADTRELIVELPTERRGYQPGDELTLEIEDGTAVGTVEAILPLDPRFEPLRPLGTSLATARVRIDNAGGGLFPGQAVRGPVPVDPVTLVPEELLVPDGAGGMKVQVVRDNIVRDVTVQPLGRFGSGRIFVSGAFQPNDELVTASSRPLADGTVIRSTTIEELRRFTSSSEQSDGNEATPTRPASRL